MGHKLYDLTLIPPRVLALVFRLRLDFSLTVYPVRPVPPARGTSHFIHHAENDAVDAVIQGAIGHDAQNTPLSIVVLNVQLLRLNLLDDVEHILLQAGHIQLEP